MMLLAQMGGGVAHWAILILIVAAIIAVMYVILNKMGIAVPDWIVTIFWILVALVVGVTVIRFIAGMA